MKNILKSLFISLYPAFAIFVFILSAIHSFQNGFSYFFLGEFIASITVIVFFAGLFIKQRARTSSTLKGYGFTIVFGLLISLFGIYQNEPYQISDTILGVFLIIGWISYIKWYSVFENRNKTILKAGNNLPLFELENTKEEKILSNSFHGKITIFIFYRGNWCPLCMAQIKEVVQEYKELEKRNVEMVLISPQPHNYTESLANKHKVPFHFLKDVESSAAKKLGIFHNAGIPAGFQVLGFETDTVLPTVIITDTKGKIIFADLTDNYRVRPEPKVFLNIIDTKINQ
ncbi:MAG: hypothetical protein COA67_05105 [Lutibacter sp.]|nr:MAG: hypothetical protein COA67_05105 [Lutibacter sp.]